MILARLFKAGHRMPAILLRRIRRLNPALHSVQQALKYLPKLNRRYAAVRSEALHSLSSIYFTFHLFNWMKLLTRIM
jgi:hypothetical protein